MADVDLITLAEAREFCKVTGVGDDSLIESFITAASLEFTRLAGGRVFKAVSAERKFYPNSLRTLWYDNAEWENTLWLDDEICALTTFKNGDGSETIISADNLLLLPVQGPRYFWIYALPDSGGIWAQIDAPIKVTAKWGFVDWTTGADEAVKLGVKRLVEAYYRSRGAGPVRTVTLPNGVHVAIPAGVPADVAGMAELYRQAI